jgi:hypothetical protein
MQHVAVLPRQVVITKPPEDRYRQVGCAIQYIQSNLYFPVPRRILFMTQVAQSVSYQSEERVLRFFEEHIGSKTGVDV